MDVCSVVDLYTCLLCSDQVVPFVRDFTSYPFGRKHLSIPANVSVGFVNQNADILESGGITHAG